MKTDIFQIVVYLFLIGCATKPPTQSTTTDAYYEDLSAVRPKFQAPAMDSTKTINDLNTETKAEIIVTESITDTLNAKLSQIAAYNKKIKYAYGYRIQVYSGNSKTKAEQAKKWIYQNIPNVSIYPSWKSPDFKIVIGDYTDRVIAHQDFWKIKEAYKMALLIEDKVNIKR